MLCTLYLKIDSKHKRLAYLVKNLLVLFAYFGGYATHIPSTTHSNITYKRKVPSLSS